MHISEIWIYPVKSLGGIRLAASQIEEKGLKYDRHWMIVDENGKFITQRVNRKMAMLDVAIDADGLVISNRSSVPDHIQVPFKPVSGTKLQVKVWKDVVEARTVCELADNWLSKQLGKPVRIVEMTESSQRKIDPHYAGSGETVSFADDFPFLLISEASLEDLNSRLAEPVDMKRFRPNFVVSGTGPFAEDFWKTIKIGQTSFLVAKPCERCVVVTIDPMNGHKGPEPLKTLATFRRVNNQVLFGQNLVGLQTGTVREGDPIEVIAVTGIAGNKY
jgi:uncharacterized protein YcbX